MTRSELEAAIDVQQLRIAFEDDTYPKAQDEMMLDLLLAEQRRASGCAYEQTDDDQNIWKCDKCGEEWTLYEGGVIENNMRYCVSCGLPILRIITHDRDEDYNETTTITERELTEGESV